MFLGYKNRWSSRFFGKCISHPLEEVRNPRTMLMKCKKYWKYFFFRKTTHEGENSDFCGYRSVHNSKTLLLPEHRAELRNSTALQKNVQNMFQYYLVRKISNKFVQIPQTRGNILDHLTWQQMRSKFLITHPFLITQQFKFYFIREVIIFFYI